LETFLGQHGAFAPASAQTLKRDIESRRQEYITSLQRSIKAFVQRKDEDALRALRNDLPASLAGSDVDKQINTELRNLADARLAKQQELVAEARNALIDWRMDRVEEIHRSYRHDLGDTPNGALLDQINNNAKTMIGMIALIDRGLKPQKRYQGQFYLLRSPHLIGADLAGIVAKGDSGMGDVTVPWKHISTEMMNTIFDLAVPDHADEFRALLAERQRLIVVE
jgi:hypothetical protein